MEDTEQLKERDLGFLTVPENTGHEMEGKDSEKDE